MSELIFRERPPPATRPACSSSTTGAAPTSTTCSASPTCSTRSGGSTSSRRARRSRSPAGPAITGTSCRASAIPTRTRSAPRTRALAAFHDELWERTGVGPERTVLGGFSMGSVMSYALGLGADRPAPAGHPRVLRLRPTVEGWKPALAGREATRVFIAHGRNDPVMAIDFAHAARDLHRRGRAAGRVPRVRRGAPHRSRPTSPAATAWLASDARARRHELAPAARTRTGSRRSRRCTATRRSSGKVRMALVPPRNHWWHVTLYVSARGLTTGPMPVRRRGRPRSSSTSSTTGCTSAAATAARPASRCATGSPARASTTTCSRRSRDVGVEARIDARPFDLGDSPPFPEDTLHDRYDADAVARFWTILRAHRRACSPRSARASPARRARRTSSGTASTSRTRATRAAARPPSPGADAVTAEAYSHEVIAFGWWPGDDRTHAVPGLLLLHRAGAGGAARPAARAGRRRLAGERRRLARGAPVRRGARRRPTRPPTLLAFYESAYRAGGRRRGLGPGGPRALTLSIAAPARSTSP